MEKKQNNAQSAAVAALLAATLLLGAFEPGIVYLTAMVSAAALTLLCWRGSWQWAALGTVAGLVGAYFLSGWELTLSIGMSVVPMGLALGIAMRRERPIYEVFLWGTLAMTLANGGLMALNALIEYGAITPENLMAPYESSFEMVRQTLITAGTQEGAANQMIQEVRTTMRNILLGSTALISGTMSIFTVLIARGLMVGAFRQDPEPYHFMKTFRMSRVAGGFYAVCLLVMLLGVGGYINGAVVNFLLIFLPFFFLNGLTMLGWLFDRMNLRKGTRVVLYGLIVISIFFPYFNLLTALVCVGVVDSLMNYRGRTVK